MAGDLLVIFLACSLTGAAQRRSEFPEIEIILLNNKFEMFFKNHDLITFSENWVDSTSKYLGIGSFDGLLWKSSGITMIQLRNFIMQKKNVGNVLFDLSSNFRKA